MGTEQNQAGKPKSVIDYPDHFYRMGKSLIDSGQAETALALVRQAKQEQPDNPLIFAVARKILSHDIPSFHLGMLRDIPRNDAYRQAIEAVVAGKRVLDIGTGSGLLAMMAARAGAAHVYACEAKPQLAETAREIVAANDFSERVTVFGCHSDKLDRDRDLGGGAEVVVSEIFSDSLLDEGVILSLNHAREQLCAPDAVFVPQRATICVALADIRKLPEPLTLVDGFDLSQFARHLPPSRITDGSSPNIALRSNAADLFSFDFSRETPKFGREKLSLSSMGGRVNAIVQWIKIDFLPGITFENAPSPKQSSHWANVVTPLRVALETEADDHVVIQGWHDASSLIVWEDAEPKANHI